MTAASATPNRCSGESAAPLVVVPLGKTTTSMGVDVTFVGSTHDDYADGHFDEVVEIRFTRGTLTETRLVSAYAPASASEIFDDLCWELEKTGRRELRLRFFGRSAR